jgi:hypothetical protein
MTSCPLIIPRGGLTTLPTVRGGARVAAPDTRRGTTLTTSTRKSNAVVTTGGGDDAYHRTASVRSKSNPDDRPFDQKVTAMTIVSLFAVYLLYDKRSFWTPFFNKAAIEQGTLNLLKKLQPDDPNVAYQRFSKPLLLYACGMAVWELLGLSTIPVESAAGMAFGWKAAPYSIGGKLLGATTAFLIGRHVLAAQIAERLDKNEIFRLVNAGPSSNDLRRKNNKAVCDTHAPLLTAFLMKFSCFPEFVKNFGSSLLTAIAPWMFLLATTVHGGTFSLLWTWLRRTEWC